MLSEDPNFQLSLWEQSHSLQICHIHDFVKTLSFLDEYIADRSNVVTYHNRQSLGSIPEVAVTYLTLIANTSICFDYVFIFTSRF